MRNVKAAELSQIEQSAFGAALAEARQGLGMNVRQAAAKAGISEGRWRQLEAGYSQHAGGIRVPANPKSSTVRAVATAVGLDLREAFEKAGLPVPRDVLVPPQPQVDPASVGDREEGAEPYLTRRTGPDLSDVTTDALLEELAKRARANNPDAQR